MRALWIKAIGDVRWQLAGSLLVVFVFHWTRVWITSLLPLKQFERLLNFIPDTFLPLLPVPKEQMASVAGRIALGYDDPLPIMVLLAWAVGRGSDAVSGELGRGTLEMVLAQPVRRVSVIGTQVAVTTLGALLLAVASWLGTCMGIQTVTLEASVSPNRFIPAAMNLFDITFFLAGLTTLVSSFDRFRARTIGLIAAVFAVEWLLKIVGTVGPNLGWMLKGTFLSMFEPQRLVADPKFASAFTVLLPSGKWIWGGLSYHALLMGLGALCYAIAITHFCRRDLPAPL